MNPSSSACVQSAQTLQKAMSMTESGDRLLAAIKAGDVAVIDMSKSDVLLEATSGHQPRSKASGPK